MTASIGIIPNGKIKMSFENLGLDPKILSAIQDVGYTEPTPIQAQAIPVVIAGKDVLGIAQTGTGKTASFTLPMIHRLMKGRAKARMPRTLILEPTRELAAQVAENFDLYGKNTKLSKALLIGGVSFKDQEQAIMRGADVLIATPGRLIDHVERGGVLLRGVEVLVIDEADRMLDMGFIPDIEKIVNLLPFTRQTLFFSATMPPEITRLADQFLSAPERIEVARPASLNESVTHKLIATTKETKQDTLRALLARDNVKNGIIFCNRKRDIATLNTALVKHGLSTVCLHGDMDQYTRMAMLDKFKNDEAKFLIASDVAARGLDIPDVSHVFNFDVPTHPEDYIHRIGRTGRAGKSGEAFTLFTKSDGKYVDGIEKLLEQKIDHETGGATGGAGQFSAKNDRGDRGSKSNEGNKSNEGSKSEKPATHNNANHNADSQRDKQSSEDDKATPTRAPSGGGRRRGFLGRNRDRDFEKKSAQENAAPAMPENVAQKQSPTPTTSAPTSSDSKNHRSKSNADKSGTSEKSDAAKAPEHKNKNQNRNSGNNRSQNNTGDNVKGFGNSMPDFMKIDPKS